MTRGMRATYKCDRDRIVGSMRKMVHNITSLAYEAGLHPNTVSHAISGKMLDAKTIRIIASCLKTTPQFLTGEDDDQVQS